MALAGKNLLNNHNYSFWYNLHYKRGFGTDPYIGDYVNAYGPDRNEFGEKFNYPSPSKYKSEMEFVNDPLVIAALRDMGLREQQIQYTAKETYKYYHDKLYRELLERLVPGK
jgi:N-formylglutamate amidohydrolase